MAEVSRSLSLFCWLFLLLTSCTSLRRDFVDPSFKAQGLKGSAITLKCVSPAGMPHGLAPQEEREILDEARRGILAEYKNIPIVLETSGGPGVITPTYSFVVYVTHNDLEKKLKRFRGPRAVGRTQSVYINVTRARVRRNAGARYSVVHLPTGKVLWQATGEGTRTTRERLNLINYYGRPELAPNVGPPLPAVLGPVTRRACAKLP